METVDVLLRQFESVFAVKDDDFCGEKVDFRPQTMESLKFTEELVEKKLRTLKTDKSPGPDCFHLLLLQEVAHQLAEPF